MGSIIKDLLWMFIIIGMAWLSVAIFLLIHLYKRTDIKALQKLLWLLFAFVPVIGTLCYAVLQFKKNKQLLFAVVTAIFITIFSVWYFAIYLQSSSNYNRLNNAGITIQSNQLLDEFVANEQLANSKYNNQVLVVTGFAEKHETKAIKTLYIRTNNSQGFVSVNLKQQQIIPNNVTLTVKGICTGYILGEVQLTDAIILKIDTLPQPVFLLPSTNKDTALTQKKSIQKDAVQLNANSILKSTNGTIHFFSKTPAEDIEATNQQIISSINTSTNEIQFAALIKGFQFDNQLMQKHFNEPEYLNSDVYPKSEFKGKIKNNTQFNFNKQGRYDVVVDGDLMIHGKHKKMQATGTITINNTTVSIQSNFKLHVQDFAIDGSDVADLLEVAVTCNYNK